MSTVKTRGLEEQDQPLFEVVKPSSEPIPSDNTQMLEMLDKVAEKVKPELSPKDVLIAKLVEIKTKIDSAKEDVDKRQNELALFRDEILRLQGAYKSLIEYGVFLNYLEYDEETKQFKAAMDN